MAQGMLQPPQCEFDVAVFVSQPLLRFPSQLPKFASHAVNVHVPVEQDSLALAKSQGVPQPPQFIKVLSAVSQPLFLLPSQLSYPMAHMGAHMPPEHVVDPCEFMHVVPHVPQLVVVLRDTSQPFASTPSQLPAPGLHIVRAHVPVWHAPTPLVYVHVVPHPPQFDVDVFVFVSHPLFGLASQLAKPIAHIGEQDPFMHDVVPFMLLHVVPHEPQFVVLVPVLTSQPFA